MSDTRTLTQASDKNADVNPGGGTSEPHKVGILVYDSAGVVVDHRIITREIADGSGP